MIVQQKIPDLDPTVLHSGSLPAPLVGDSKINDSYPAIRPLPRVSSCDCTSISVTSARRLALARQPHRPVRATGVAYARMRSCTAPRDMTFALRYVCVISSDCYGSWYIISDRIAYVYHYYHHYGYYCCRHRCRYYCIKLH